MRVHLCACACARAIGESSDIGDDSFHETVHLCVCACMYATNPIPTSSFPCSPVGYTMGLQGATVMVKKIDVVFVCPV